MVMWAVNKDWWFKGPFRRFFPWFLGNIIVKIAYAGEIYTTEETVAFLENIYKDTEENGDHLHISISPCICRDATDNWSDDMPNLTCMHLNTSAEGAAKGYKQSLLLSGR